MNQNDYYIAFDENGAPYIEHGLLDSAKNVAKDVGRGVRENYKYILKVIENGKNRYFYTQKEVDAYYKAKKAGIKNAAEYARNTVKGVVDKASGDASNKEVETTKEEAKRASDAEKAASSVKNMIDQAKSKVAEKIRKPELTQEEKEQNPSEGKISSSIKNMIDQAKSKVAEKIRKPELTREEKEQNPSEGKISSSTKNMIDNARKAIASSNSGANAARKAFKEYSDNDSDFDEKNYSRENRVEDTDFYTFKRKDGKSVILEEDMKWVLPKGVDAGNPAIKSALKQIANSGTFKTYDDWLENANDILGDAIEKVRDKEK